MTEIVELFPNPSGPLDRAALLARYAPTRRDEPRLRVNFIQSVDGSATLDGRSGGLGAPADKTVFDLLRVVADAVLVGAGTARAEGYGALTVPEESQRWRIAHDLPAHPAMALVSARLDLDPASDLFAEAPMRPLVFTARSAPTDARARLDDVATVIDASGDDDGRVDPARVRQELVARGLPQVLCEGGPTLFGDLVAADLVDELCLTVSPVLEGGAGPRITRRHRESADTDASASSVVPRDLALDLVLRSENMLLTRWSRA